ncbi:unnamed protein product [Paramecium primaurelia]|uniref:Uncharacterized protein n=1 Tax=Paramecium primaurelia TaxID=5886 RepID=A0A8S1L413_PARPR|nr:unnamed protein product [Paramecium primaurelia]
MHMEYLTGNYFQLINFVDNETKSLNFIQYECLDDTTKEIKKFHQLGFSQTEQFIFSKQIEPSQYDDIWFFFQIISYISKKKVELAIYSQLNQIQKKLQNLAMPNRDQKQILYFGWSLKVYLNKRISIEFDYWSKITQYFQRIETCQCDWDKKNINQDSHLIYLDQLNNVSMKINCNTYTIAGWLQISNIYQISEEFTYQFMKINYKIENLVIFQQFYLFSPIQNKLIITKYQYYFLSVTLDFSKNPLLIRRELPIYNSITSWQYVQINLQESVLEFSIIFYEGQYTQSYKTTIDIKQFDNYQLKITYRNIQQSNLNYLDVIVKICYLIIVCKIQNNTNLIIVVKNVMVQINKIVQIVLRNQIEYIYQLIHFKLFNMFFRQKIIYQCITCESGYLLQDGSCYENQEQIPIIQINIGIQKQKVFQ